MPLTWDIERSTHSGYLQPDGKDHRWRNSGGDRYVITLWQDMSGRGNHRYQASLVRFRDSAIRLGHLFDSVDEARAACEEHRAAAQDAA